MSVKARYGTSDPIKILGKGAFGIVYEGLWDGKTVAIKRIEKTEFLVLNDLTANSTSAAQQKEEEIMIKLDHPNVVRFLHVENDDIFKYLMLELCVGTVSDYVKGDYKGDMPSEIDGMIQMANGLQYIHTQNFVHRDIKPANVLISSSCVLKISDFGISRPVTVTSQSFSMASGPKGTRIYYSPEFLSSEEKTQEEKEQIRVNVMIDIFSLGCLFFNFITKGGHPFANGGLPSEILTPFYIYNDKKVLNGEKGLAENHYACAMIDGMTQASPEKRWKLEKVLNTLKRPNQTS